MTLTRAWIALIILSGVTSAVAFSPNWWGPFMAGVLLLLIYAKGRLVLDRYLGLSRARRWQSSFAWTLALFLAGCYALYLMPLIR